MSDSIVEVWVNLPEEETPSLRGTNAVVLGDGLFKLLATDNYDPEDEIWEFLPGSTVKCIEQINRGKKILLAVKAD